MVKWTVRKSLFYLIGSGILTVCVFGISLFFWIKSRQMRLVDEKYHISTIIQTGQELEALQTSYLAELIDLSIDKPVNLYAFDLKKGEMKLLSSPLISKAHIQRLPPHTLYIDYEVRKPIAWLGDYQNIAIDQDGYLFPMAPFFAPKELPEIYLGLPSFGAQEDGFGRSGGLWFAPLKNRYLDLAFELLHFFEGSTWREGMRMKRIDVSQAFALSLGQREIVLSTEEDLVLEKESIRCVFPKLLRLSPKEYVQQMNNFLGLRKKMTQDYHKQLVEANVPLSGRFSSRIVDLRIPHLAFVEN